MNHPIVFYSIILSKTVAYMHALFLRTTYTKFCCLSTFSKILSVGTNDAVSSLSSLVSYAWVEGGDSSRKCPTSWSNESFTYFKWSIFVSVVYKLCEFIAHISIPQKKNLPNHELFRQKTMLHAYWSSRSTPPIEVV